MQNDNWEALVSGNGCPLCAPRPPSSDGMVLIATLGVSSLYLNRSQTYRGACILVYDTAHKTRIDQLSVDEWQTFAADMHAAQQAIVEVVSPDHMNTESLGNVVPHLHFHLVPRYKDDGRWRDPVWLSNVADMRVTHIDEAEFAALRDKLRDALNRTHD
jgi:diadenosine tetraphosphate (Ap4A) HIT family hydrolase